MIGIDHGGKHTGYKFRLETTSGKRMIDINAIIMRYRARTEMMALTEFMLKDSMTGVDHG